MVEELQKREMQILYCQSHQNACKNAFYISKFGINSLNITCRIMEFCISIKVISEFGKKPLSTIYWRNSWNYVFP